MNQTILTQVGSLVNSANNTLQPQFPMTPDQLKDLEDTLWKSADTLRANTDLKASEYSTPVMGLIFLKFADNRYKRFESEILGEYEALKGTRREKPLQEIALTKCGFYLPPHARYSYLLSLPDEVDVAKKIQEAMAAIETYKPELKGTLPQDEYFKLTRTDPSIPGRLLKNFSNIPDDWEGDLFGQIYEYFLGNFAIAEGQGGGEFFTPRSVVRLMVEIIEPHGGKILDPACGSGGMFVQSSQFIEASQGAKAESLPDFFVYGQEKTLETVKLAKMNLAVNNLRGDIRQAITYYEDHYKSFQNFDYVLANPPFNVDDVNLKKVENDPRFSTYGIPRNKSGDKKNEKGNETVPNANYLWINLFATSLKERGRAALVMANSASDARHSEADIRKTLIENNLIYGMLTLPSNMFYTVTLPATLWFFDKAKPDERILFIDARNIFTQIDRAHRAFSDAQIQNIALISRLHKGNRAALIRLVDTYFAQGTQKLAENAAQVMGISAQLLDVLDDAEGKEAVQALEDQWQGWETLEVAYRAYTRETHLTLEVQNQAQHALQSRFDPFFAGLHEGLKALDRLVRQYEKTAREANGSRGIARNLKTLKDALETLRAEVRDAEAFFGHIHWLQERFPEAKYEDVTGLCKLATLDEVREQEYSLNPGRYVGVVIEEDGKTEEEFIEEMMGLQDSLSMLSASSKELENVILHNIKQIMKGA